MPHSPIHLRFNLIYFFLKKLLHKITLTKTDNLVKIYKIEAGEFPFRIGNFAQKEGQSQIQKENVNTRAFIKLYKCVLIADSYANPRQES